MRAPRAARPETNAELGKDLVQVGSDGPVRQEEPLADLLITQAGRGQHRDLAFLWRERIAFQLIRPGFGLRGSA